jgi:hypothetical protein
MKSYRLPVLTFICLSFCFLLWGCLEYNIVTQVMPNGRILRTVIVKGDSSEIFTGSFRVPSDSSWNITTRYEPRNTKDNTDSEIFVYEAVKEFENVNALNKEFHSDSVLSDRNNVWVNIEKTFYGFYSRYVYTETYSMLFPFRSVPVSSYMNKSELEIHQADEDDLFYSAERNAIIIAADSSEKLVMTQSDSVRFKVLRDSIENKFEKWQKVNVYNEYYNQVIIALRKMGGPPDTSAGREPFFNWLDTSRTFETGIENDNAFAEAAGKYFHVNSAGLYAANREGFDAFNKKFRVAAFSLESYTNTVRMPGKIVKMDAGATGQGSSVTWNFKIDNFYATDFVMTVESQLLNKWFIALAGFALLVLVFISLWFFGKKNRIAGKIIL